MKFYGTTKNDAGIYTLVTTPKKRINPKKNKAGRREKWNTWKDVPVISFGARSAYKKQSKLAKNVPMDMHSAMFPMLAMLTKMVGRRR